MQFESLNDFLAMNGHGLYVWISYAVALVVIVYNVVTPLMARKRIRQQILRQIRRAETNEPTEISRGIPE